MNCSDAYAEILDLFAARASGRGWDGCCPFAARHRNGDRRPSLRLWVGERGELVARCYGCGAGWGEIVRATGTAPRDWWPEPLSHEYPRRKIMSRITAVYDYRDSDGNLYAQKVRKEPGPTGVGKSFSWRRPLPQENRAEHSVAHDADAWVWGLEEGIYAPHEGNALDWRPCGDNPKAITFPRLTPSVYRLPQLLAEPFEHPVVVVEGERKADALYSLGLCAVSGPSGARLWDIAWGEHFRDRKVVVIPDNNPPGLYFAGMVVGSLLLHGAAGVKPILPGAAWDVEENKDIHDWLLQFPKTAEARRALLALFGRFRSYLPGSVAAPTVAA